MHVLIAIHLLIQDGALEEARDRGIDYLVSHIDDESKLTTPSAEENLCHYFKLPLVLFTAGKLREAHLVLSHIKTSFMQDDGDFRTSDIVKYCSLEPQFRNFFTYANVWIAVAAQRMERYDVAAPAVQYMKQFFKKFTTDGPPSEGSLQWIPSQ
eukprot:GHVO01007028.1.p1 GENE.GHVO01007028.1~~GHVO01007028.1.p1  ORF type:complete len:154 (-),score=17.00 GHVO01007028.1:585-1046(-)